MDAIARQNKKAWEHGVYGFWAERHGEPEKQAAEAAGNPRAEIKIFSKYFVDPKGERIANVCGSRGKYAVPLALLGARATVFDISEENRRYASEVARAAGVALEYVVGDVMDIDLTLYGGAFDTVFMEGGILHYFHDLHGFARVLYGLLRAGGKMVMSDFHPIHKILDALEIGGGPRPDGDYFNSEPFEGEMPHAKFYEGQARAAFPKCVLRKYTLAEILSAVVDAGFILQGFEEIPAWNNPKLPGIFILSAGKPEEARYPQRRLPQ